MRQIKFSLLVVLLVLLLPRVSFAQKDTTFDPKKEIVINDKRFRVYNNWVSVGLGGAWHSANPHAQLVISGNYNFHIKWYYFRLGGMISGDNFGTKNNFQFHGAWIPYRRETEKFNLALMGGLSYSTGYTWLPSGHYDVVNPYSEWGGYAEAQWIKKIVFDIGYGGAFFVNVNSKNTIVGVRLDFYLSGAYKGYVKGKQPPPKQY